VPAELYQPSMRKWKGPPEQVSYPGMATRRVKKAGAICYEDQRVFISQALAGWDLGLRFCREQMLEVYFAQFVLGVLETPTAALVPITAMQSTTKSMLGEQRKNFKSSRRPKANSTAYSSGSRQAAAGLWLERQRGSSVPLGPRLPQPRLRSGHRRTNKPALLFQLKPTNKNQ
jgi:hypothetical protein